MPHYRDDGVVLRTYKLGEADRIVVIYTRGRGKIRCVAKGIRRTKSKFGARLDPASVVHLQCYEGRNLDIVTQVESREIFVDLRADLDRYGRAAVLLEIVDQVAVESESNPALYKLLTGALSELNRTGNPMVVPAFVAKVLVLEGVQPYLEACVNCEATEDLVAMDVSQGGVLCRNCRRGDAVSPEALQALLLVFSGQIRAALDLTSEKVVNELEGLSARMIEQHIERRLRTSEVLQQFH
jgi:DNA repair protein RecO (recombination protein O)